VRKPERATGARAPRGPGSGCSRNMRRPFDPDAYRLILFDQRQCGRSTPDASDPSTDLCVNTTEHLLADIEMLRTHTEVDRWLIFGGSWGCTLGLAYAERYRHLVTALVLSGVTTTRRSEIDWLYRGVAPLYPEQYARFRAGARGQDGNIVEAYRHLLEDGDAVTRAQAAKDWCDWENALLSIDPNTQPPPRRLTPEFQMAFARIVTQRHPRRDTPRPLITRANARDAAIARSAPRHLCSPTSAEPTAGASTTPTESLECSIVENSIRAR